MALCSCGIAYVMRFIRAASEGAVELGLYPDKAKEWFLQTMRGAVELLESTGANPESEIDKVTTPGGPHHTRTKTQWKKVDSGAVIKGPASIGKTLTAIWGVNKVILLGNVGVDPTIRYVETRPVATFTRHH